MNKKLHTLFEGLHTFLILWVTQSFSALGSSMTSYALVVWSYQQKGSALTTALLSICSYAPYVLLSIFAGALSDRWNKKRTMLVCDSFAAATTLLILILLKTENLALWHLYILNALNGLMNTLQQPASDVAVSLLTPREQYQRVSGLRAFSNSLVTVLTPVLATMVFSFAGIDAVLAFDLITFSAAFITPGGTSMVYYDPTGGGGRKQGRICTGFCKRRPQIPEKEPRYSESYPVSGGHQLNRVHVQRRTARHDSFQKRGKQDRTRYGKRLHGRGQSGRKPAGLFLPSTQKQGPGYLQFPADRHVHGKFLSGLRQTALGLVRRRHSGLDLHSVYECEHGCAVPFTDPADHAGTRLLRPQYAAVFHHTGGILTRRTAGGPGV